MSNKLVAGAEVAAEVAAERARQDAQWGEQNHPDGTHHAFAPLADAQRARTNRLAGEACLTWREILEEEVLEALACDPGSPELRAELVQVAAVATAWVECIDRRGATAMRKEGSR